jgi:hypothetical protein
VEVVVASTDEEVAVVDSAALLVAVVEAAVVLDEARTAEHAAWAALRTAVAMVSL